jgi:hypothetical protein
MPPSLLDRRRFVQQAALGALALGAPAFARSGDGILAPDPSGDDTLAFQTAAGKLTQLQAGATYVLSRQISWPPGSRGAGFTVAGNGQATVIVKTGTGGFAQDSITGGFSSVAFYVLHAANPVFRGLNVVMEPNPGILVATPLAMRGCSDIEVDYAFAGFKEGAFGYTAIDSCTVKNLAVKGLNCNPNSTASFMDISVVEVDDNMLDGVNTTMSPSGTPWRILSRGVHLGPQARAKYSEQSNGLRLSGRGHQGIHAEIDCQDIGQVVDCWSDDNVLQIRFKNAYIAAFAGKYGGAHNSVDIKGDGTGLYGVFISGYPPSDPRRSQSGSYNHVTANITGIGSLLGALPNPDYCVGVLIDGGANHPGSRGTDLHDNVIEGRFIGAVPPVMRAVIANATGAGRNIFKVKGGNFTESFAKHTPDAAPPVMAR